MKSSRTWISIHAPREGGDFLLCSRYSFDKRFQSTPPARGGDRDFKNMDKRVVISIHAPREGGDGGGDVPIIHKGNFNPRPPRGGRP